MSCSGAARFGKIKLNLQYFAADSITLESGCRGGNKMAHSEEDRQIRIENYKDVKARMLRGGYRASVVIVSILKAHIMAVVITAPMVVLSLVLYRLKWGRLLVPTGRAELLLLAAVMVCCVPVHEWLHGATWSSFCKMGWRSVHIGVLWKALALYCSCKEALPCGGYLLGVLMPFAVLGVGIFLASYIAGNAFLLLLGLLNIIAAGGDLYMALLLLRHRKAAILDHPSDCGFTAFYK
jgi:hypothetical protein